MWPLSVFPFLYFGTFLDLVSSVDVNYLKERENILEHERLEFLGGKLILNAREQLVNEILMDAKRREYDCGFQTNNFPPMKHFFSVKEEIEASEVFKIIKLMPKGAALHMHDVSITSVDYLVNDVAYRDNVYLCIDTSGLLLFHFFEQPDKSCNWTLVSDLRAANQSLDEWFRENLWLVVGNPEEAYPTSDAAWKAFESSLLTASGLILYAPVFKEYFYLGLKELYDDNVMYLELRGTLPTVYELNGTTHDPVSVVAMYKEVAASFVRDYPDFLGARFIYAPLRRVALDEIKQKVTEATLLTKIYTDFFAGFDLVGQETKGYPLIDFVDILLEPSRQNPPVDLKYFFHAGETAWEGISTDENLVDAILLNTTRIGHGYAITKHPLVKQLALQRNIPIEVCPISNQVLHLVGDLRNHPMASLMAEDFPIVISSDDPPVWGATGLSYDFYEAFMGLAGRRADLRTLKQLAMNSIKYSVMSEKEKKLAMYMWNMKWEEFLERILLDYGKWSILNSVRMV